MTAPRTILVCRLSALGDVVLSLAVVDALREAFPDAHLALLSRVPFGRVATGQAGLDELALWDGPGAPLPDAIGARAWDVLVDLSATGRSRRLLARVKAGRTLRPRKESLARFAFVKLRPLGGSAVPISPALDRLFSAVAPLGVTRGGRRPRFPVGPPPGNGPVLLAPGGARGAKRWPAERFGELAARISGLGRGVVLVGSAEEAALLETVAAAAPPGACEIHAGADLARLPGIAARCPIAVTNDSGVMHLVEAAGVRVVALFGPTHPRLGFAPLDPGSVAIHGGIRCSPCDLHGPETCPRGHHRCLRDLPVETVLDSVASRLDAAGSLHDDARGRTGAPGSSVAESDAPAARQGAR